jgi:hypothetical protein
LYCRIYRQRYLRLIFKMAMYYLPLASRFNQDQLEKAAPEVPLSGPPAGDPASNPAPLIGY